MPRRGLAARFGPMRIAGIEEGIGEVTRRAAGALPVAPKGWPPGSKTVVRRVKVKAATISTDPRPRRRRTIPADQLTLALDNKVLTVYAYTMISPGIASSGLLAATASANGCSISATPWLRPINRVDATVPASMTGPGTVCPTSCPP